MSRPWKASPANEVSHVSCCGVMRQAHIFCGRRGEAIFNALSSSRPRAARMMYFGASRGSGGQRPDLTMIRQDTTCMFFFFPPTIQVLLCGAEDHVVRVHPLGFQKTLKEPQLQQALVITVRWSEPRRYDGTLDLLL